MNVDIKRGIEEVKKIKELINDPVVGVLNDFVVTQNMPFEDVCFLKNLSEKGVSLFSFDEIIWIVNHHHFWLNLIKSPKGKTIFLEFYKRNNNCYQMSKKTKINRKTITKWTQRFLNTDFMFIDILLQGKEKFLVLNKGKYPNLVFLTKWFILEKIGGQYSIQ